MGTVNEIKHYGVPGMRWGVRKSGSSGLKGSNKDSKVTKSRKKDLKKLRTLTDKELKEKIERLSNEKKLKELIKEDLSPGKSIAKRIVSESGQKVAKTVLTGASLYAVQSIVGKQFDRKEFGKFAARGGAGKK